MARTISAHRVWAVAAGISLLSSMAPSFAAAQGATAQKAWLYLRPHCEAPQNLAPTAEVGSIADVLRQSPDGCANYRIRDPQTQETSELAVGSTLDMDLVLLNPSHLPLSAVHAALSYDPQVLDGVRIDLSGGLPVPTPGEQDFVPDEGIVKVAASANPGGEPVNGLITVARIQFMVKRHPRAGLTPMGFDDIQPGILQGRTQVVALVGGSETNIISPDLGSLVVKTSPGQASSAAQSSATTQSSAGTSSNGTSSEASTSSTTATSSAASVSSAPPEERTAFVLLQVQNVRVGTEGGSISVTWDGVNSVATVGYNIYYGTEKGRYIQRHSVDASSKSHVIRGLPVNSIYYLAVRAYNDKNEESAFSREVMVKTGDPRSSTAPLLLSDTGPNGQNPLTGDLMGDVPGQTGIPTNVLVILVCIAIVGTAFAFRRQFAARSAR